ncbi:MAG: hypothetical protein PVI30_11540 [Myxococcales bacterium]|jgi:hypothetical protein
MTRLRHPSRSVITSTWKKSIGAIAPQYAFRNNAQGMCSSLSGDGWRPAACKMRRTVDGRER